METAHENVMTDAQLELVRQVFARLEALEAHSVSELCHDDFELHWKGLGTRRHTHQGPEAFQRHLDELSEGWDEVHVVCDNLSRNSDRVLAMYHLLGHSNGTRAESPHAALVEVRDDRLARWDAFQDAAHSFDWLAAESRLA